MPQCFAECLSPQSRVPTGTYLHGTEGTQVRALDAFLTGEVDRHFPSWLVQRLLEEESGMKSKGWRSKTQC